MENEDSGGRSYDETRENPQCSEEKHTYRNQKELGSTKPPSYSPLKGERRVSSLSLLSHRGDKAELLQHRHDIVVDVDPDELPIPDLHGIAEPQFGRFSCRWHISRRQV